jgi:predicted nucleic acid-binding protein
MSLALQKEAYSRGPEFITLYILIPAGIALAVVLLDMFWHRKRLHVFSGLFFGVLGGLAIAYILSLVVDLVVALLPAPPAAAHPGAEPSPNYMRQLRARLRRETSPDMKRELEDKLRKESEKYAKAVDKHREGMEAYRAHAAHGKTVQLVKLVLGAAAVFFCVTIVMQTKDDFRFVIPYVEFSKQTKGLRPILLDTSVIIDGRIADITDTGVLESDVVVPRFILAELQAIADSEDKLKRNRGRRGLDVLNRLQGSDKIDIQILDPHVRTVDEVGEVDAKLVALAKHLDGRIVTNDYNLNKIAQLRGVDVVNINDLANALKPVVLPGESLQVRVIKPGEEPGQGVGYLEDGTMVVAEHGRDYIGRDITIAVTSVLQTSAGRMIFGRLDPDKTFGSREKQQEASGRNSRRR